MQKRPVGEGLHLHPHLAGRLGEDADFAQIELAAQGDALGPQPRGGGQTVQIEGVHLGGSVHPRLGQGFPQAGGQADVLHDEGIGASAPCLAGAFEGGVHFFRQNDHVEGHVHGNAAQMGVVAGLLQGFQGEVVGIAAGVELIEPQIHRVGPCGHSGVEGRHVSGGRQQLN